MRLKTVIQQVLSNGKLHALFSAFTPTEAKDRGPFVQTALAAGTVTVFGIALATATSALALLLVAVGVAYYVLTQLLDIKLELDPQVLLRQAMQAQRPVSAPN
ncbi:MAG: hypothetical protein JNM40_23810 [Myxococcales bacterium]|nr:hypothetical protein [Myxococcales bacterium]